MNSQDLTYALVKNYGTFLISVATFINAIIGNAIIYFLLASAQLKL